MILLPIPRAAITGHQHIQPQYRLQDHGLNRQVKDSNVIAKQLHFRATNEIQISNTGFKLLGKCT